MTLAELISRKMDEINLVRDDLAVQRYCALSSEISLLQTAMNMLDVAETEETERANRRRGRRTKGAASDTLNEDVLASDVTGDDASADEQG